MATAVRTVRRELSPVHDGALEELGLSDDESDDRIDAAWLELADSDEVVLSICGRDRRLRIV